MICFSAGDLMQNLCPSCLYFFLNEECLPISQEFVGFLVRFNYFLMCVCVFVHVHVYIRGFIGNCKLQAWVLEIGNTRTACTFNH